MYQLIKAALVIFMLFPILGCDNLTSSQNKIAAEKTDGIQSEDCVDDVSSRAHSSLEPIVAKGCAIN